MYVMETYFDNDRLPVIEKTKICGKTALSNPDLVNDFLNQYFRLGKRTEEYVYLMCLDIKSHLIGVFELSHGTINSSALNPRETYMKALLCGAANIIIAHNHPSEDISPSQKDLEVMGRIKLAGEILSVPLIDFIICGNTCYFSAKEKDLL